MVGWLLTEKSSQTKHGDPMEFATFEDLIGLYDASFFPEPYRRYGHLLSGGKPYMMEGLVEEDFRTLTLTVNKIWVPSPSPCFHSSIDPPMREATAVKPRDSAALKEVSITFKTADWCD